MSNPVAVALVAKCDQRTALAWIGDRQAWLSREGRKWQLCDDYTGETVFITGADISYIVRKWGDRIGVNVDRIDIEMEY